MKTRQDNLVNTLLNFMSPIGYTNIRWSEQMKKTMFSHLILLYIALKTHNMFLSSRL